MLPIKAADTVYVSATAPTGGDGSTNAPFNTINKAINETQAKTVIVLPGLYRETVALSRTVTLVAPYGPNYTHISSTGNGVEISGSSVNPIIQGFMISALSEGIWTKDGWYGGIYMGNLVIQNVGDCGIAIGHNNENQWRGFTLENSIIYNVKANGIQTRNHRQWFRVRNTTITKCAGYAFNAYYDNGSFANEWDIQIEYSNISNSGRDYTGNCATYIKRGDGMSGISDPKWVGGSNLDQSKLDFRLMPNSSLRDIGHPLMAYNDPDNSRNDIGAYGGPGSLGFFENPTQGPLILGVTVDNPYVPRGARIAIRAKTSVYK
jgi:hypothetical protein